MRTAEMPVAAPPIVMLTVPPAVVHTTAPVMSWFFPSNDRLTRRQQAMWRLYSKSRCW